MIARLTRYRVAPEQLEDLLAEIVALARAARPADGRRRAELFFVDHRSGNCLSVVIGDQGVRAVIELARRPSGGSADYEVRLLQVGGPTTSGIVPVLLGRVVSGDALDLPRDPPRSPEVWVRAFLAADTEQLALAVGTDRAAVEASVTGAGTSVTSVADYDDVPYHFFFDS